MRRFKVQDGERVIEFEGHELASISSYEPGKSRWIELALYKTRAGTYVLTGCGRSIEDGEVDRHWVQLAADPDGIIDRLYLFNDLGAKYIPHTSRKLITMAGLHDDAIREAFATERVA